MRYGISASSIVVEGQSILLVHHQFDDGDDFWVTPGGRLEGTETILECAVRETFEETNLKVESIRIAYVQDFLEREYRFCKFHVLCRTIGGDLSTKSVPESHVTEARFFSRAEVASLRVFPEVVSKQLWVDLDNGIESMNYLGMTDLRRAGA